MSEERPGEDLEEYKLWLWQQRANRINRVDLSETVTSMCWVDIDGAPIGEPQPLVLTEEDMVCKTLPSRPPKAHGIYGFDDRLRPLLVLKAPAAFHKGETLSLRRFVTIY